MGKWITAVTDDRYGDYTEEEAILGEAGGVLEVYNLKSREEAVEKLQKAQGILLNLFPFDGPLIRRLPRCRVISRYGVGYDNVDVPAATEQGVWVARVPHYADEDASDHALALFLAWVRKLPYKDRLIREGAWNLHRRQPSFRIQGKVFGLVGYGGIGQALHRKLSGLGLARILVCDPTEDPEFIRARGGEKTDLEELLRLSDYVSLHLPLNEKTAGLISRRELALMKPGALLINTARGGLVDEGALAESLKTGALGGAALDVFAAEPLPPDSPLLTLDNLILTDHAGWYSEESLKELKTKAALTWPGPGPRARPSIPLISPAY
jgi:D-3-phosphoglycerate dehydrogenase